MTSLHSTPGCGYNSPHISVLASQPPTVHLPQRGLHGWPCGRPRWRTRCARCEPLGPGALPLLRVRMASPALSQAEAGTSGQAAEERWRGQRRGRRRRGRGGGGSEPCRHFSRPPGNTWQVSPLLGGLGLGAPLVSLIFPIGSEVPHSSLRVAPTLARELSCQGQERIF